MLFFFFFNDTATTEIYTLSLHDALPISVDGRRRGARVADQGRVQSGRGHRRAGRRLPGGRFEDERERGVGAGLARMRSEEHTSELQSRQYLVCRLLLEKKKIRLIQM